MAPAQCRAMKGLHPGKVPCAQVGGCQFKRLGLTRVGMANMAPAQCRAMKGPHPGKVPSAQNGKTGSEMTEGRIMPEPCCLHPCDRDVAHDPSDRSLAIRSACTVCSVEVVLQTPLSLSAASIPERQPRMRYSLTAMPQRPSARRHQRKLMPKQLLHRNPGARPGNEGNLPRNGHHGAGPMPVQEGVHPAGV